MLEAAARQEHKAALAAATAAVKSGKQEQHRMQKAAEQMAWRTQRWQIAHLRRITIEVNHHFPIVLTWSDLYIGFTK